MLALFLPVGILIAAGLVVLSAISLHFFTLQLIWVAIGAMVVAVLTFIDARAIFSSRWMVWVLYGGSLLLLIAAYLFGPVIRNTKSWLVLGPISIQPVEF